MTDTIPPSADSTSQSVAAAVEGDEVSAIELLTDLAIVLAKYKKLILGLPIVAAALAAAYVFYMPNIYTASTKILPPQQNQPSAVTAMVAQLGGLLGSIGGFKNSNEVYVAMLKSRTVADNLTERFGVMKLFNFRLRSQARQWLEANANIRSGKDGLITIDVDDEDPRRAAEIANAYVDELLKFTNILAVTEASQRRLFFEQQLIRAKENLGKAEVSARRALEQGGLVKVDEQGRVMVENTARLRAQVTAKEVQIGAMRTFATDLNPELQRAQQELESMKRELAKIEGDSGTRAVANRKGGQGIENLGLLRDLKYYETLYELLAKQYEMAKIDEARDSSVVQVMDKAIEPDRKSKPSRRLIVVLVTVAAGLVSILLAFLIEGFAKATADPEQRSRLNSLRAHLRWK